MVLSKEINYVQPFQKQCGESNLLSLQKCIHCSTRGTQLIVPGNDYVQEPFNPLQFSEQNCHLDLALYESCTFCFRIYKSAFFRYRN